MLSQVQINLEIANQTRTTLKGLHQASIVHGDIRAASILVDNNWVYLIDLNVSITLPHQDLDTKVKRDPRTRTSGP
jgi:serine/threonine-protein kinase RIO1